MIDSFHFGVEKTIILCETVLSSKLIDSASRYLVSLYS